MESVLKERNLRYQQFEQQLKVVNEEKERIKFGHQNEINNVQVNLKKVEERIRMLDGENQQKEALLRERDQVIGNLEQERQRMIQKLNEASERSINLENALNEKVRELKNLFEDKNELARNFNGLVQEKELSNRKMGEMKNTVEVLEKELKNLINLNENLRASEEQLKQKIKTLESEIE